MIRISPSILSADNLHFFDELQSVETAGADFHHVDVMDGHFVPNLTFGLPLIESLKKKMSIPLDVHIMISNPDQVAADYVKAGADILTFHYEAATHHHRLIQQIKSLGAKAGLAFNPGTSIDHVLPILGDVDLILLMSVNPGFSGQKFIPGTLTKLHALKKMIQDMKLTSSLMIQVDGGINEETAAKVKAAGANVLVAGHFVYKSPDRQKAINLLKSS